MKIYNTKKGVLIDDNSTYFIIKEGIDALLSQLDLYKAVKDAFENGRECSTDEAKGLIKDQLLAPIENQEVWASGVTYMRSKEARMDESKDAGGGDFYDKVYDADRPEVFFKSTANRVVGSGEGIRIREDSKWNVPEPELTLVINPNGQIVGYAVGNDMSSRDIEGENPLYLPQAKTYDKCAGIGPCILVAESPISLDTKIEMAISREGKTMFEGEVKLSNMKRKFDELVHYLFRECSFSIGCFLMTGTGIVPPNSFTLAKNDEIRIGIEPIGTLVNIVE